ncbi:SDR family NAD(P)-dependent oxidoreductase [Bifidobacterium psychraerophilum]|uniref:SDR family NAD(P)-dependent oxidoreductase n=1 Tax=Bifidobacterium psychraerophilum TaxID=218140 RepID=UPI0039EB902F
MSKVIAVFGAGTGLGLSMAREYGRHGYQVALVGRNEGHLAEVQHVLESEGIESAPFVADLDEADGVPALISAIRGRFGRIDVIEYSPLSAEINFIPAKQLDAKALAGMMNLLLLTPVNIVHEVLPEFTERGTGAIFFTFGATALHPTPNYSGIGTLQSAARHYLMSLQAELKDTGIVASSTVITAMISGSGTDKAMKHSLPEDQYRSIVTVDPDDIAATYWNMQEAGASGEAVLPTPLEMPHSR